MRPRLPFLFLRPRFPRTSFRGAMKGAALSTLLLGGIFSAGVASSSASRSSACVLPSVCSSLPLPTLPEVPLPVETGTNTTSSGGTAPGRPGPPSQTNVVPSGVDEPAAPLSFTVRTIMRRTGGRRWIDLQVSLSEAAAVVAILQRRSSPVLAAVRTARPGANAFVLTLPRRVRSGRYELKIVLATATVTRTLHRRVSVPK